MAQADDGAVIEKMPSFEADNLPISDQLPSDAHNRQANSCKVGEEACTLSCNFQNCEYGKCGLINNIINICTCYECNDGGGYG